MDPMPLAGGFCATFDEAQRVPLIPLTWVRCGFCGLVQVLEDVRDEELYSKYQYASSTVQPLYRHFTNYAESLTNLYGKQDRIRFLEVGCNDGVLLKQLPPAWERWGVDPSDVALQYLGDRSDLKLLSKPFSSRLVEDAGLDDRFDVVSGSNCFAHVTALGDAFEGVARCLRIGGHFWLEVHDLEALLRGNQWDTIYHEHKVEWSISSLRRCLESKSLRLVSVERLPLHGGLIRACFVKDVRPSMSSHSGDTDLRDGLRALRRAYEDRYEFPTVREMLIACRFGKVLAAYGAAGRATVFLNQMRQLPVEFVVDDSPMRAGKFVPAAAIPIVNRTSFLERQPAMCLITAWNYRHDIMASNPGYMGEWKEYFSQ